MPINSRLTWQELLDSITRRQGEIDVATNIYPIGVPSSPNVPYDLFSDVENLLLEVSNAMLRQLSFDEMMNVGTKAITTLTGASPLTVPNNAIGILSASVDGRASDEYVPATFLESQTSTRVCCYSFISGQIKFIGGASGTFNIIIEPTLADWRANNVILPPAYDNKRINEVCNLLEIADYLPVGRLG